MKLSLVTFTSTLSTLSTLPTLSHFAFTAIFARPDPNAANAANYLFAERAYIPLGARFVNNNQHCRGWRGHTNATLAHSRTLSHTPAPEPGEVSLTPESIWTAAISPFALDNAYFRFASLACLYPLSIVYTERDANNTFPKCRKQRGRLCVSVSVSC